MYYIKLCDWFALAPGLPDKEAWAGWTGQFAHDRTEKYILPPTPHIPMMQARRMGHACRLACEVALRLLEQTQNTIDAAIFISQHGELQRSAKIIESIISAQDVSPTDFSMSVHNTAAGLTTILSKQTLEVSSLSACTDSFQQGFYEVQAFFAQSAKKVMVVDFDDCIPEQYQYNEIIQTLPYACGFVFSADHEYQCTGYQLHEMESHLKLPQSMQFLINVLAQNNRFSIQSLDRCWSWIKQ
jgi:hypothetical protein